MNPRVAAFGALLRRFPFATGCVILTLAAGGTAWWLSQDIDNQEVARVDRAKEGEATLELLVGGSTQRQELASVREAARRIEDNLVREDLADNQWYFYHFEGETKANLVEFHPQSAPPAGDAALYRRFPYSLRVTGTFEQVTSYLRALETGPRLANIISFTFSRRDKDAAILSLELNVELLGKK